MKYISVLVILLVCMSMFTISSAAQGTIGGYFADSVLAGEIAEKLGKSVFNAVSKEELETIKFRK